MTQEAADKIFNGSLGSQLSEIFVTSDDRVFISYEEADKHRKGQLDEKTLPLLDQTITTWYPRWITCAQGAQKIYPHLKNSEQDLISITSVDNLHLHTKADGGNLANDLNKKEDGTV